MKPRGNSEISQNEPLTFPAFAPEVEAWWDQQLDEAVGEILDPIVAENLASEFLEDIQVRNPVDAGELRRRLQEMIEDGLYGESG